MNLRFQNHSFTNRRLVLKIFRTLSIIILFFLSSCKPNGKLINEKKSTSYFISNNGKLTYCFHGNLFELGETVFKANIESFEILTEEIAKDKYYVYYEGKKQPNIDTKSFYIENDIPKDKNYAYTYDYNLIPLKYVDAKSYESLANDYESSWSRDCKNYYRNEKKVDVDRESFVLVNKWFSKDKNKTYVDFSERFFPIFNNSLNISKITSEYIKKNNSVYYVSIDGIIHIEKNDFDEIKNIRILNKDIICINNKVIVNGKSIKFSKVDTKSFKIIGKQTGWFTKDQHHVYYDQLVIDKATPKTFKLIELGYGKDDKNIFNKNKLLKDADVKTFRIEKSYSMTFIDDKGNRYKDGKKY